MSEAEDTYSAAEAARILRISKRRVQQMARKGELEATQDEEGRWRIPQRIVHERLPDRPPRASSSAGGFPGESQTSGATRSPARSPGPRQEEISEGITELLDRIERLGIELGAARRQVEITEKAESSMQAERERLLADLERERERAERLERELSEAREREREREQQAKPERPSWWRRLFQG